MDLERIIAHKRHLWAMPSWCPAPRIERARPARPGRFTAAVSGREVGIVASVLPRSWRAAVAYEAGGAAAVSAPADELLAGGGPDIVGLVAGAVDVPVLFSDVVVDSRQLDMAYACGADAVRIVVRALDDAELADLAAIADGLGLDALHSAADAADVERALDVGAAVVGLGEPVGLEIPVPAVLEGGSWDRAGIERVAESGFTGCVVDAGLLDGADPAAAVRRLTGVAV
ncbi:hypothetical protein [Actinophytocola sp.]|uniref:hypothetical protein n=1 Tax=Actinophytocola sp. TaxID=1872138 RepID=UPI003D6B0EB4